MTNDLIQRICEAHGGLERWKLVESIELQLDIFGPILITKFKSPWLSNITANVFTDKPYVSIHNFPEEGHTGIFDGFQVYIYNGNDKIYCERNYSNPEQLKIKPRLHWDHMDLIYFLGHALWGYSCSPYLLTDQSFDIEQGKDIKNFNGNVLNTLHVHYPSHIPTRSKEQVFYFNQQGLLCRNDYTTEANRPLSIGSQFCGDYKIFDGLVFPTHRTIFPRLWNGTALKPFKVMDGRFNSILVNWRQKPNPA